MNIKKVIKMFEKGNVCICGLKGSGKDMLFGNVIMRRNKPYISNVNYGGMYCPLRFDLLDCGMNTYVDFLTDNVKAYEFPYPDKTDIYISDAGIYFPCQYNEQLNKKYGHMATFQALSRHLGDCSVHSNSQALNRVWDKFREQSDKYIMCKWCKVFFGKIVIQKIVIYEKYESAVNNVVRFRMKSPLGLMASRDAKAEFDTLYALKKQDYENTNGKIKEGFLLYINKSTYDTRRFKEMLKNGKKE